MLRGLRMKVLKAPITDGFEPFTVPIRVESAEDASKLFAMFNHSTIVVDSLDLPMGFIKDIKNALDYGGHAIIGYRKHHDALNRWIDGD